MEIAFERVIEAVGEELTDHGFRTHSHPRMDALDCIAFWRLCTLNINRAVAVLRLPESEIGVGEYCQKMKWRLLWLTRFVPFIYELGLQVVVCGDGLEQLLGTPDMLKRQVDSFSNQFVVLQSIFAVDTQTRRFTQTRTWGQVVTAKYQDAIVFGIRKAGFMTWELD
jgi:hypothetical protein